MPTFEETIDKATAWDGHTDNRTTHGIVCKAINSDGTTLLAHASGTTHPSSPSSPAITPSNTFHLASCTKLLTSICALQCVERGLIGLDDPLDAYLPELCALPIITTATASTTNANANASNPDAPETPAFTYRPRSTPLTLRHLLTHTSGLAYAALHPVINAWRAANNGGAGPGAPDAAGDVVRDCSVPFVHEPGEGWTYGTGLDWAGKLVERLNGRPPAAGAGGGGDAGGGEDVTLEAYMSENIWAPLALRDSTFLLAARPDVEARLVATAEKKRGDGGGLQARAEGAAVVLFIQEVWKRAE
ncbi:putative beta-lactamase family protein [Diplodia seriata]|uniref:Putative beta-lactamase family protein n=1 Tax=Diplodia seriata TaxID=420778 RepID=A0A0G2GP24_9PEZI|nr:putative beta-lactamase family protein [Diplodia seriata]